MTIKCSDIFFPFKKKGILESILFKYLPKVFRVLLPFSCKEKIAKKILFPKPPIKKHDCNLIVHIHLPMYIQFSVVGQVIIND